MSNNFMSISFQFQRFLALLERICQQPYAKEAQEYVQQFRSQIRVIAKSSQAPVSTRESVLVE